MTKVYPITTPVYVKDYSPNSVFGEQNLPDDIKKEMAKVAKMESCEIENLTYNNEIYFCIDDMEWKSFSKIIVNIP